ncbi:SPARC-like protein 1 [Perognathus longimembris pacificus]|uniref:SPARC-like protein 1 n=1 Tax=Perognathus longimembris pacificus TaxID=214514 RepID=UPI00201A089D|nr:SPARC-like protein 1 [Perognathus longimembris pacificus]
MRTVLVFLFVLGTTAAIPTNARFLSDYSTPTAEVLVTPDSTAIPTDRSEAAENEKATEASTESTPNHTAETPSIQRSEEENPAPTADQDKTSSHELGLKDQEDGDGDVSVENAPTEGTLDSKEALSETPKSHFPEVTDPPEAAFSSYVESQQENTANREGSKEQPVHEAYELNKNSSHSEDLMDEGSQEHDPHLPNGDGEDGEKEPEEDGVLNDEQENEKEVAEEHSNSKQEEDSDQSEDILEDSNPPTQASAMQDESEHSQQGQGENSNAETEEDHASNSNKQSEEGKADLEVTDNQEDVDRTTVPTELTGDGDVVSKSHEAEGDGDIDDAKHGEGDDYLMPSEDSLEAAKTQPISSNLKHEQGRSHEDENVDTSEAGVYQEAKKAESSSHNDETSSEDNARLHGADSCVNFQCKRGHICKAEPQGIAHCVCQDPATCPPAKLLDQVCGTDNQTYTSSCHLFATKCRLEGTKKGHQLQMDYFGACKSIPVCTDFEVAQFPLRMRDWLKNILVQLYEPNPKHAGHLNEKQRSKVKKIYLDEKRLLAGDHPIELLLRDFKKNYHMYVYPVHWQFNELDQHPKDRVLTHSELAPLRASLVPLEHCITRFFEECDPNKDKHITLQEWGHCFGIKEEDIDENLLF